MKKTMKRIVAVVMALTMLLSVVSVSALAANKKVRQFDTVTSLGDSVAVGFSMPDYYYKAKGEYVLNKERIKDSYPDLVATGVNAQTFYPLAQCGFRTVELRMALDPSYKGDDVAKRWQPTLSNHKEYTYDYFLSQYPEYEAAIKDSDLVLLDIGMNDTWITVLGTILNAIEETPNTDTTGETLDSFIEDYGSIQNVIKYINFKIAQSPYYVTSITKALYNTLTVSEIKENYDVIVKKIYEINPNATIVAMSTYNGFKDWQDASFIAPIVQKVMYDPINEAKASYEKQYPGKYIFVTDYDVTVRTTSAADALNKGWDPHPTAEGHKYIANQILNALSE